MNTKHCGKCNETKPTTEFSRNKKRRDGLQSQCKKCMAKSSKAWNQRNRDRHTQIKKAWYEANKDHVRAYNEANKNRIAEHAFIYRKINRERLREQSRVW